MTLIYFVIGCVAGYFISKYYDEWMRKRNKDEKERKEFEQWRKKRDS